MKNRRGKGKGAYEQQPCVGSRLLHASRRDVWAAPCVQTESWGFEDADVPMGTHAHANQIGRSIDAADCLSAGRILDCGKAYGHAAYDEHIGKIAGREIRSSNHGTRVRVRLVASPAAANG